MPWLRLASSASRSLSEKVAPSVRSLRERQIVELVGQGMCAKEIALEIADGRTAH